MLTNSPSQFHYLTTRQQLLNLLVQAPVPIVIYNGPALIIAFINDKCLEMWNKTRNDVLNKPLFDIFSEARGKGFEEIFEKVYKTGQSYTTIELPAEIIRYGKLNTGWFNTVYEPLLDENGKVTGIMSVATEVTEQVLSRKKIEESEKIFKIAIDQSPAAIAIIKVPEFVIELVNKKWLNNMNAKPEDLIGKPLFDIFPALEEKGLDKILKTKVRSGLPHHEPEYEIDFSRYGGSGIAYFDVVYQPLSDADNVTAQIMIICHDITDLISARKKMEESEIHLKELEKRKDDFIRMANHELKTPVTSIKGYVQLLLAALKDEEKKLSTLLLKSSLVSIDKQITRLTRLISELLDLSKIETGTLELNKELVNLNEFVIETVQDILYTNSKHNINVFHDFGCSVYADKDRLGQVLINCLTNAIKYSPNADKVEVWIKQTEKNSVSVSIKDYGIGIDKKYHEKIFERFYRAEGKEEQTYPGFGIGLFIAKEIVQRHEGSIYFNSEKGKGSVFTFTLPILS